MKKTSSLLLVLAIFVFLFGCVGNGTEPGTQNTTQNITQNTTLYAQFGDNVTVDYTLRVDGRVMDTSLESEAKNAGMYNQNRTYKPIAFQMLLDSQMINGFVKGVVGMQVNETKNITVSPADGYGLSDSIKIFNLSRHYNMSVHEQIPISYLLDLNITPKVDKVFPTSVGYVSVENVTNDTVTIRYLFTPGHKFVIDGLPESVENMTNETMLIRLDVVENGTYVTTNQAGAKSIARVTYAGNDTVTMDENHPLAGKQLEFEITVRSISSSNPNSKT